MLRSSFSVGGRASRLRPGMMWSTIRSRPAALLLEVLDLDGLADDHDGAVVDVGVVGGAGHDQPVDEGHRHADLDAGSPGAPEQATGGRSVEVDDVPVTSVGEGDDHGEAAVRLEPDVADEALVQDGVDGLAVVGGPVRVAVQRGALRCGVTHGQLAFVACAVPRWGTPRSPPIMTRGCCLSRNDVARQATVPVGA